MKSKNDHFTAEIFGNRPGRPRKVNSVTGTERVRKHRAHKTQSKVSVTRNENCTLCIASDRACSGLCNVGQLG